MFNLYVEREIVRNRISRKKIIYKFYMENVDAFSLKGFFIN